MKVTLEVIRPLISEGVLLLMVGERLELIEDDLFIVVEGRNVGMEICLDALDQSHLKYLR